MGTAGQRRSASAPQDVDVSPPQEPLPICGTVELQTGEEVCDLAPDARSLFEKLPEESRQICLLGPATEEAQSGGEPREGKSTHAGRQVGNPSQPIRQSLISSWLCCLLIFSTIRTRCVQKSLHDLVSGTASPELCYNTAECPGPSQGKRPLGQCSVVPVGAGWPTCGPQPQQSPSDREARALRQAGGPDVSVGHRRR